MAGQGNSLAAGCTGCLPGSRLHLHSGGARLCLASAHEEWRTEAGCEHWLSAGGVSVLTPGAVVGSIQMTTQTGLGMVFLPLTPALGELRQENG